LALYEWFDNDNQIKGVSKKGLLLIRY